MIIVTGAAGFIGSVLTWRLNAEGVDDIIAVDHFGETQKWQNLAKRRLYLTLHKDEFLPWLKEKGLKVPIDAVFHLGACSSTTEMNFDYLLKNNVHYSMELFKFCTERGIPLIYASSAATYGAGELGYKDDHGLADQLRPLNPYGFSKKMFDSWVLRQEQTPTFWAGLKFFNVFGPNEYHKESMRSVVCKAVPQIQETSKLKLFKSHKDGYADGEQKRDFVYVKDAVDVMLHFWQAARTGKVPKSGLYNVGTGKSRTFLDLGRAVFAAMRQPCVIEWMDMPESLRDAYQYFTEADLTRLRKDGGYDKAFTPLEEAIEEYLSEYMLRSDIYL